LTLKIISSFKKAYRDFTGDSIIAEIALIFTVITVVNSIMMVAGWDQPKQGAFAHLHLLGRLGIVSLVVVIFEYDEILSLLKSFSSRQNILFDWRNWLSNTYKNWFSTVAVLFTTATVLTTASVYILQEMLEPVGGERFYWNLLILFAIITVSVLAYTMIYSRKSS